MKLAIIGGTGAQGSALAWRFARAGVEVVIGSRNASRGAASAASLNEKLGISTVQGTDNRNAASQADVVLLALPYDGMKPILEEIRGVMAGKVAISIASALSPARKSQAQPPPAGSITAEVQQFFGESVRVVAAFQNISPERLASSEPIDADVLVCGANRETREAVIALVQQTGVRALDAGSLANAVAVETLTAVLIALNIKYKVRGAGIRITGLPAG